MHNLVKAAPEFDGTGDILFWLEEIQQYIRRHRVSNDVMECNIIVGTLTGAAREWFGSLDTVNKEDQDEVIKALKQRYGKTYMQRLREFEILK